MKVATIFYHKNIKSIYKLSWIEECINSVLNQTYNDFTIYELNYGADDFKLSEIVDMTSRKYNYYQHKFNNHADAMNFILNKCIKDGADVVFNNNMDDYSENNRFEIQIKKMQDGYDIVSSNFNHIDSDDVKIREMNFSSFDIKNELRSDNNIIAHPCVCYSRNFLLKNKYNSDNIPKEDLILWKNTIDKYKFFICPEILLNYRLHENQITSLHNKKISSINEDKKENIQNIQNNINYMTTKPM